jgi:hypothetical protein
MSGNLVPTPIVDKNGVQTTRKKRADSAPTKNRVAGVGAPGNSKRIQIENPMRDKDDVIEVGKVTDGEDQLIYFNGTPIGMVEKRDTDTSRGGSKRYVTRNSVSSRWYALTRGNETDTVGERSDNMGKGDTTRIGAVQHYVRGYYRNMDKAQAIKDWEAKGVESFKGGGLSNRPLIFRDKEISTPGAFVEVTSSYPYGGDLGPGERPNNAVMVMTKNLGAYKIALDGDSSTVSFRQGINQPEVVFPLDHHNGVIEEPDEPGFHSQVQRDQRELFEHAQAVLMRMFN